MLKAPTRASTTPIRIVLVEPYEVVRTALRAMLDNARDVEIVREETCLPAALETLPDDPPDVVLVGSDIAAEALVPALQRLKRDCPATSIVVLGHRQDDSDLFRSIQAGAAAHISDTIRPAELARTLRAVAAGEYLIDAEVAARPLVARRVLDAFREATLAGEILDDDPPRRAFTRLTKRETEVLIAISEGMANKEIAALLAISPHTVRNIVKAVLRKLAVNNRTRAVLVALRESWIPAPSSRRVSLH